MPTTSADRATLRRRRVVVSLVAAVLVVGLAIAAVVGLRALWTTAKTHFVSDTCTIGAYDLDPSQASVAATMVGAVTQYRITLPERVSVLVLAAALQESKLTNIPPGQGDRDSVGVLQQRPSQGWGGGSAQKLTDVGEATKEFVDALLEVPHWQSLSLADAIQAVQVSADGSLYAQHEQEAQALADALSGRKPAAITCDIAAPTAVAAPRVVAAQARKELGIDTPVASGDTVRVPGARWQTVAWFVANAYRLGIEQVDYAGRSWTRTKGWQPATTSPAAVVATMYQLKKKG